MLYPFYFMAVSSRARPVYCRTEFTKYFLRFKRQEKIGCEMLRLKRIIPRSPTAEVFGLDLRSLALFRICLALLILIDLWGFWKNIRSHFTDSGVLPRYALRRVPAAQGNNYPHQFYVSLHRLSGTVGGQRFLFAVQGLFALALLGGYRTKVACIGSWLMLTSLQRRNPLILQGDDAIRRFLLFWSMFLPLGARFSIDQLRARKSYPPRVFSWGTVGYVLQVAIIYWCNGLAKSDPVWRKEGTAVYYALRLEHYTTRFGKSLLRYPRLLKMMTFLTLGFELIAPCLLFIPRFLQQTRLLLVASFAFFHTALGRSLTLGMFGLTCITAWLAFLPSSFWQRLGSTVKEASPDNIRDARGEQTASLNLSKTAQGIAIFSLFVISLSNLRWLFRARLRKINLAWFDHLCSITGLYQFWNLFAPRPNWNGGWYVIQGTLENGSEIDLLQGGTPLRWEKPDDLTSLYGNHRWRNLHTNLGWTIYGHFRTSYAQYLRQEWNRSHPDGEHLKSVRLYYMVQEVPPPFKAPETVKILLWDHNRLVPRPPTQVGVEQPASFLKHQLENGDFPEEARKNLPSDR